MLALLALGSAIITQSWAQSFTTNSPLLTARWSHTATLLTNGLVLIAGGTTANEYPDNPDRATNSCELYDPVSSSFMLTGAMTDAHAGHFAVVLTNGLVLAAGGRNDHGNIISQAELYDASTGNWTNTGFLNQERSAFAAALLPSGEVLVVAGFTDHGDESSAELYDPVTGNWSLTSPLNYAADSLTATVLADGRVLVAGGSDGLGGSRTNASLFNPTNHTWTPTGPLKAGRSGHAATLLPDGKVLVVGGTFDNSTELYDPATGQWTYTGELNEGRRFPSLTVLPNGQALVIGGSPDQTTAELYEPSNATWTNAATLNVGRMYHTATLLPHGQVLVTGGDSGVIDFYNGPALPDVETYNQLSTLFYALDDTNLVWTTGGDANWFLQTTNTHDKVSAGQSGVIGDNQQSWIQTTVTGPGMLSFWWRVSGAANTATLEFDIDDAGQDQIYGEPAWSQLTVAIPPGDHTLKWVYYKLSAATAGYDAGFLDEVYFLPDPPSLNVTAAPLTGELPLAVQFFSPRFDSRGQTVTNWHWSFGDGRTSTARNPTHLYTSVGAFSPNLIAYSTSGALPLPVTGLGMITVTNNALRPVLGTEPQLSIRLVENQVILTLLNRPPGTVLETTTNFSLPAPWPEVVPLADDLNYLLLEPAGVKRYFRLRAPANFSVASVAPPLDQTTFVDPASAAEFIYAGTNSIQTGVAIGVIQPTRASVLRGRVLRSDGTPLASVRVSVLGHPELGQAVTRADGYYDLAVNGGCELRLNFEKTAILPAQRTLTVPAQDCQSVPEVRLLQLDPSVTAVTLGTNSPGTVARGSTQTDADGSRTATLIIPPGTCANLVMPDGSTQACNGLMIRATEYTVGSNGPAAMPGALPPTSGYTYAVELSADEAINAGAKTVLFDRDIPYYLENFIGIPVGVQVPTAYYDREKAAWVPIPDGQVIRITQVANNLAELDTDGDGLADADQGASLGVTIQERARLATLYAAGQTLWRVPIRHLTPYDLNYGISPAAGAKPPGQPEPQKDPPKLENPSSANGYGRVEIENRLLTETIPIAGTPFTLNYGSDQAGDDPSAYRMLIHLSGTNVPAPLKGIQLTVGIAGRTLIQNFPPDPNQDYLFVWDGLDAYGRKLPGQQTVSVQIDYVYQAYYNLPPPHKISFALASGIVIGPPIAARQDIKLSQSFTAKLGGLARKGLGLGGWDLSVHHQYDPGARVLYMGDGGQRQAESINLVVNRFAGKLQSFGVLPLGDGGPAINAWLSFPYGLAFGPDGSLYIAEGGIGRIRRVTPDGIIHTVAGGGPDYSENVDGKLAVNINLNFPTAVAVGPDGSVYISADRRVYRVTPNGIISTVAGTGGNPAWWDDDSLNDNGLPATQVGFYPGAIAVARDGTLYLEEGYGSRVLRVGLDGILTTFAGRRSKSYTFDGSGFSGDGGPATEARLNYSGGRTIALGPDGSLYIADSHNFRVRRVTPDGIINTVVGGGSLPLGSDGVPAAELNLSAIGAMAVTPDGTIFFSVYLNIPPPAAGAAPQYVYQVTPDGIAHLYAGVPHAYAMGDLFAENVPARHAEFDARSLAVGPDGAVYLSDNEYLAGNSSRHRVRRISPPLPGFDGDEILIPSTDASEVYVFNKNGRHLRTLLALTGATLLEFHYDGAGRLSSLQDGNGLVTTIEHDASGNPTGILAPFGQHTILTTTLDGFLASVANPAGETTLLGYTGVGLLSSVTGPKGDAYTFTYDAGGHLLSAADPAGGSTTLTYTNTPNGYEVQATTALGRISHYLVETLTNGVQRRLITYPDGTHLESLRGNNDGNLTTTFPAGTVISTEEGPDPRFGMQSPIVLRASIRTPAGLTNRLTASRTVLLANPDDVLSVTELRDSVVMNGRTNMLVYSASNRTFIATTSEGRTSTNRIDALARVIFEQQAGLNSILYGYDARGLTNLLEAGGAELRGYSASYNAAGLLASFVDPLGQLSTNQYDASGRIIAKSLPGSRFVRFTNDAAGFTTAVLPPGQPAHSLTYTQVDLLATYTAPVVAGVTNQTRFLYNADRQPSRIIRPDGQLVDFLYDGSGRLQIVTVPGGETFTNRYDPITGRLTNVVGTSGQQLAIGSDGLLLTSETWSGSAVTGSVSRVYDSSFRVITRTVNQANPVDYSNSPDGLIVRAGSLTLTRHPQHGFISATVLSNLTDTCTYDGFGSPNFYAAAASGIVFYAYSLAYDPLGRITNKQEVITGITNDYAYLYDAANRLAQVRSNSILIAIHTYDPNGNRLSRSNPPAASFAQGTYDAQDRLVNAVTELGTRSYFYNPQGQRESTTLNGQATQYQYDAHGNLRSVTLPNLTQIDYVVDASDRRIGKKINGTLVNGWLYQGQLLPIVQLDGANQVVCRFVYASRLQVPDYLIRSDGSYRLVCDHLGSVRLVVNAQTGTVVQRLDYDEYGRVTLDTNPGFQPFGFAGGLYDADTGLVRFGWRDYDPIASRWTAKDPLGFFGGDANLYAYCANDPLNCFDPSGTDYVLLNDSYAVLGRKGSWKGFGHNAAVVGSDKSGWDYFCKEGDENNTMRHYPTLDDFYHSPEAQRYDRGARVKTTPKQDAKMKSYGRQNFDRPYDFFRHNCSDLAGQILKAGGGEIPNVCAAEGSAISIPNDVYDGFGNTGYGTPFTLPK